MTINDIDKKDILNWLTEDNTIYDKFLSYFGIKRYRVVEKYQNKAIRDHGTFNTESEALEQIRYLYDQEYEMFGANTAYYYMEVI